MAHKPLPPESQAVPTVDPELTELFLRAKMAWGRWVRKPHEQAPLPLAPREPR